MWDLLKAGATETLSINKPNVALTEVIIDIKNTISLNPSMTVDTLKSNPLQISPPGKIYQYIQLTKNFADADTSKITINFRVPKSWLTTNAVVETDVVLYRYSDNQWESLTITLTGSDVEYVTYSSTTPGFSNFAIGSKETAPVIKSQPNETAPAEAPAPPTEETPVAPKEENPPVAEVKKQIISKTLITFTAAVILIAVVSVYYILMWMQKKRVE